MTPNTPSIFAVASRTRTSGQHWKLPRLTWRCMISIRRRLWNWHADMTGRLGMIMMSSNVWKVSSGESARPEPRSFLIHPSRLSGGFCVTWPCLVRGFCIPCPFMRRGCYRSPHGAWGVIAGKSGIYRRRGHSRLHLTPTSPRTPLQPSNRSSPRWPAPAETAPQPHHWAPTHAVHRRSAVRSPTAVERCRRPDRTKQLAAYHQKQNWRHELEESPCR